jgi:hypothetical protein
MVLESALNTLFQIESKKDKNYFKNVQKNIPIH